MFPVLQKNKYRCCFDVRLNNIFDVSQEMVGISDAEFKKMLAQDNKAVRKEVAESCAADVSGAEMACIPGLFTAGSQSFYYNFATRPGTPNSFSIPLPRKVTKKNSSGKIRQRGARWRQGASFHTTPYYATGKPLP